MFISKNEFIDFIFGFVEGYERYSQMMSDAYKKKSMWEKDEWIYVKDIEMCLKGIYKLYKSGEYDDFSGAKQLILDQEDHTDLIEDVWIQERIRDCRRSLEHLEFPEEVKKGGEF